MKYLDFLKCVEFRNEFLEYCYCDITGMQIWDDSDFIFATDELNKKLIEFFTQHCDLRITHIANYPESYIVNIDKSQFEYYNIHTMFTELIEKTYDFTTD